MTTFTEFLAKRNRAAKLAAIRKAIAAGEQDGKLTVDNVCGFPGGSALLPDRLATGSDFWNRENLDESGKVRSPRIAIEIAAKIDALLAPKNETLAELCQAERERLHAKLYRFTELGELEAAEAAAKAAEAAEAAKAAKAAK